METFTGSWRHGLLCTAGMILWTLLSVHAAKAQQSSAASSADSAGTGSAGDTTALLDIRARVMAFTNALDSVYTAIGGTYYGIEPILRESCYDCHSGRTRYPWYYKIPGIHGMIDEDIKDGRRHLDMDQGFPFPGRKSQEHQLQEMREEIES